MTLEYAEARLHSEAARVQTELERRAHARPLFRDCATRYLAQQSDRRSQVTLQIHVRLLLPHIGDLQPQQVHDATLAPFVSSRIAGGASATTINRSLEVVRAVLNRAARSFRDADGTPWLTGIPPLISMLPESRRPPYPITWDGARSLASTVGAVITMPDAMFRENVVELAAKVRLPTIYAEREFVDSGGLMSCGPSVPKDFYRAATYVDKIFKGARPADLPVEQPTSVEPVINMKAAKTLGVTIPQSVILRADEVIQ